MPDDATQHVETTVDPQDLPWLGHNPFLAGNAEPEEKPAEKDPEQKAAPEPAPQAPVYQAPPVTAEAIAGGLAQALQANDAYRRQEEDQRRYWAATQQAIANPPRIEDPEKLLEDPAAFAKKFEEGIRWAAQAGRASALAEMAPTLQQAQAASGAIPQLQQNLQSQMHLNRDIANGLARQLWAGEGNEPEDFDRLMPVAHNLLHQRFGDAGYWQNALNPTLLKEAVGLIQRNTEGPTGPRPQQAPRQPVSIGSNAPSSRSNGTLREQIPEHKRAALRAVEDRMGFKLPDDALQSYLDRSWTDG